MASRTGPYRGRRTAGEQALLRVASTVPAIVAMEDYIESFTGHAAWDGKLQCLPIAGYRHMLHYRMDLFQAAGVEVPKTFEELMVAAKYFA